MCEIKMQNSEEYRSQFLSNGILTDECIQQLLYRLQELTDATMMQLKTICENTARKKHQFDSDREIERQISQNFRRGLKLIATWNMQIKIEEASEAVKKFPFLPKLYRYGCLKLFRDVYRYDEKILSSFKLKIPPFHDFLHTFYCHVAKSDTVQNVLYYKLFGFDKKLLFIDSLRSTLFKCIEGAILDASAFELPEDLSALKQQPKNDDVTMSPVSSQRHPEAPIPVSAKRKTNERENEKVISLDSKSDIENRPVLSGEEKRSVPSAKRIIEEKRSVPSAKRIIVDSTGGIERQNGPVLVSAKRIVQSQKEETEQQKTIERKDGDEKLRTDQKKLIEEVPEKTGPKFSEEVERKLNGVDDALKSVQRKFQVKGVNKHKDSPIVRTKLNSIRNTKFNLTPEAEEVKVVELNESKDDVPAFFDDPVESEDLGEGDSKEKE